MTTDTITFTPRAELKKGVFLLGHALLTISKAVAHLIDQSVRKYPYVWLLLVITSATLTSLACIGQARAERDSLNKKNYELQQKVEALNNMIEARDAVTK